jgi:hypothetical protein
MLDFARAGRSAERAHSGSVVDPPVRRQKPANVATASGPHHTPDAPGRPGETWPGAVPGGLEAVDHQAQCSVDFAQLMVRLHALQSDTAHRLAHHCSILLFQGFSKVQRRVKKKSQSSRMHVIKKQRIQGATQHGLYNIVRRKQGGESIAVKTDAIAVSSMSASPGRKKSTRQAIGPCGGIADDGPGKMSGDEQSPGRK